MRSLAALLLVALIHSVSDGRPPAPKGQGNVVKGWGFFVDPDKDCEFKFDNGNLTLIVPAKPHEMHLPGTGKLGPGNMGRSSKWLNAPRVLQPVKGDFTVTLDYPKFTAAKGTPAVDGEAPCLSAGIFVWKDDSNFVRLARFQNTQNSDTGKIQVNGYKDGKLLYDWPNDPPDIAELKVERTAGKVSFRYRVKDAKEWLTADKSKFEFDGEVQVGVIAGNRTTAPFAPVFSGLKVEERK